MPVRLDTSNFTIRGRLGADPETRVTASGKTVCTLSIATSWSKNVGTDAQGKTQYADQTDWHRTVAFGKDAEILHKNCRKGDLIQVSGRISPRSYTDKDNIKRYTIDFVIVDIEMMQFRKQREEQAQQSVGQPESRHAPVEESVPEFNPEDMPG